MTEPTYEYIKGKGWVPYTALPELIGPIIHLACGTSVRLEFRQPNPGERWDGSNLGNTYHFPDGKPDWNVWSYIISSFTYNQLCDYAPKQGHACITVVPL